MKEDDTFAW